MANQVQIRTAQEVVNSLKFYFMLSTYLTGSGVAEKVASESLNEFIKEGEGWHSKDSKILSTYLNKAYNQLPSEFLSLMKISSPGDRDQISFKEKTIW